jgi:membrane protein
MWAGANWAKNLKRAIAAQMRDDYDDGDKPPMFVLDMLANFGIAIVLLLALGITIGLSTTVTSLSSQVLGWLGLEGAVSGFVLGSLSFVVVLIAGFGLFWFLTGVVPRRTSPRKIVAIGSLIGAIGMAVLQYLAAIILGAFSRNAAASLFGPVIVLMLFLNIFATLILMVSAWIATYEVAPPVPDAAPEAPATSLEPVSRRRAEDPRVRSGFRIGTVVGGGIVLAASAGLAGALAIVRAVRGRCRAR